MSLFSQHTGGNIIQPITARTQPSSLLSALLTFSSEQGGRNIFRNAQGIPYIIDINASGKFNAWKGNEVNSTSWTLLDDANAPDEAISGGGGNFRAAAGAMDSTGAIHFIYLRTIVGDVQLRYVKFENDQWSGDTVLRTGVGPHTSTQYHTARIAVDSNDKLHIAWNDTRTASNYSTITYINNVSGSWSSNVVVSVIENVHWGVHDFIIDNANLPIIAARRNSTGDDRVHMYRGNANDATSFETSNEIRNDLSDSSSPRIGSLCVDSSNNVYYAYLQSGTLEIQLVRRNAGDAWTGPWTTVGVYPWLSYRFNLVPIGTDIYIISQEESSGIRIPGIRFDVFRNGAFTRIRTLLNQTTFTGTRAGWANYGHRAKDGQVYAQASVALPSITIRATETTLGTRVITLDLTSVALGGQMMATGRPLMGANLSVPLSATYNIFAAGGQMGVLPVAAATLSASPGVYTLTGADATLTAVTSGAYEMSADAGTYALTGQDATFTVGRVMSAEAGSYTLTGQDATLIEQEIIVAEAGTYTLTGQDADFDRGLILVAESGTYTLTGQDATFTQPIRLTAEAGTYTLTGQDATFAKGYTLSADAGTYSLTGQDAGLLRGYIIDANAGSYTLTGQDATLQQGYAIDAQAGAYNYEGEAAALFANVTQCLRPTADTDNSGSWIVAPLWSKIDDEVGTGDADQINSPDNPGTQQPFTVKVTSDVSDPQTSANHILRFRAAKTANGGADYNMTVEIRQGYVSEGNQGTLIASSTETFTNNTPSTRTLTLSGAEADSITNYTALYLRVFGTKSGGGPNRGLILFDVEFCVPPGVGNQYEMAAEPGTQYLLTGEEATLQRTIPPLNAEAGSYLLTGQDATFARTYAITAESGTYTLTGQDATLIEQEILEAEAGTYLLTGQDTTLTRALSLTAEAGSYILTGQDVDFLEGRIVTAEAGSYLLTGQDADFDRGLILISEAGSYVFTGQDATLIEQEIIVAEAGAYVLTGQDATFIEEEILEAEAGTYVLTGQDADLSTSKTILAEAGSYVLTGQAADLIEERTINAEAGAYVLTGQDATFAAQKQLNTEAGTYVFTGQDADFDRGLVMFAEAGSYLLTGQDADLIEERTINAEAGSYILTGQDVDFDTSLILIAEAGSYLFTGEDFEILRDYIIAAEEGAYVFDGESAFLAEDLYIIAEEGDYVLTGQDAELGYNKLDVDPGAYDLIGEDASFVEPIKLQADAGNYILTGQDADFDRGLVLLAEAGAYDLTGEDANLIEKEILNADPGDYNFEGESVFLATNLSIDAEEGAYNLTGQDTALLFGKIIDAEEGTYNFEGEDFTTSQSYVIVAEEGVYNLDGEAVFFAAGLFIAAEEGTYTLEGEDADLRFFRVDAEAGDYHFEGEDGILLFAGLVEAEPGDYNLDGEDIDTSVERVINAEPGVFVLKGEAACLEWLRKGRYEKYECFTLPFIGVKGACERLEPTSGMWVNSLPGITLKKLSKLVTEGDLTAVRFFRRIEKAAIDRVLSDVTAGIAEDYQVNSVMDHVALALSDTYNLKKSIRKRTRIWKEPDQYMSLRIEKISLKADDDVTTTIYIDDGFQDVKEYIIELQAGKTGTIRLDFESNEDYIDVWFDSACANFAELDCGEGSTYFSFEYAEDCGDGWKAGKGVIGLRVAAICDSCQLLGSHLDALALPTLYMTGILIMQEIINSDRVNPYVRNSKKEARKMLFHWYGGLDEKLLLSKKTGEYHKVLAGAIRQVKNHIRRIDSDCVSCSGLVIH